MSLSEALYPHSILLVQPRKHPNMTEQLLTGTYSINLFDSHRQLFFGHDARDSVMVSD